VIFAIGTTTHVIPAAVQETTLHDTHGVPICLWLVDTDYNPKMHVGGQTGTAPDFFVAVHHQISKLTKDISKLKPLTNLTATQIEYIRKFDAQLFTGQLQMVINKIQTLQEIKINVSGEITTTVEEQGPSFWEQLLGGIASAATGALGAALVSSIESAGEIRKSVTEAATNTINDIAKNATGGAFKTIGDALSKFQTASNLLERKLTAMKNEVLGKFETLNHITQTIDTVKNWIDPDGNKKPLDRRLIDNTTKIEILEKQMTNADDITDMKLFLSNLTDRVRSKGYKDIPECMNALWKDVDIIDLNKHLLINTRLRVEQIENEIQKIQRLKRTLDTTIAVVSRLEQRIEAIRNLYGTGGLEVVYNTGDIFPLPL
jgi:DNA repair exonuclease SbcCD ATPase subunit